MSLAVGDWVVLPDGVLAQVSAIDGEPPIATASAVSGGSIERPLANAELRWIRVPEDGLRVRLALDADALRTEAEGDPVILVAASLRDEGGEATTAEIRHAVSATFETTDELRRWWSRAQKRLDDDPRIDARDARQKRYRLLAEGQRQVDRIRPRRSGEFLHGLELLDGPRLLAQRDKSRRPSLLDEDAIAELLADADLDLDATIDPTDRFLTGEIAVRLGRRDDSELGERLGASVLGVDMVRVRGAKSRRRALALATAWFEANRADMQGGPIPVVASAAARRDVEEDALAGLVRAADLPWPLVWAWAVGWAVPGSAENKDPAYPDDLVRYRDRVRHVVERRTADSDPLHSDGRFLGACLGAMRALDTTTRHGDEFERTMATLGGAFWGAAAESDSKPVRDSIGPTALPTSCWLALIDDAPSDWGLRAIREPVERAYLASPGHLPILARLAERTRTDLGARLLALARDAIRGSRAQAIALDALGSADDPRVRAESVTLAGTIASDHEAVIDAIEQEARQARAAAIEGDASRPGPLLFTEAGWRGLVRDVYEHVQQAHLERDAAVTTAAESDSRAVELEQALERRRSALEAAQASRVEERGASASRLSINLLKPVAAALADSYESGSLGALQDQLRAVLTRLRIMQIGAVDDVVAFDPDRHTWLGDGYPSSQVRVVAPGWEGTDGDQSLVLVTARVTGVVE